MRKHQRVFILVLAACFVAPVTTTAVLAADDPTSAASQPAKATTRSWRVASTKGEQDPPEMNLLDAMRRGSVSSGPRAAATAA